MKARTAAVITFVTSFVVTCRGLTSYAPFTEGWWHVYSRWIKNGKVPYRDFELLVPPGYPLLLRSVTELFGESFLTLRIIGAAQIGMIGVCIFFLTVRFAGQAPAVLFSSAAISYLSSGTAFISYDYVYTALLLMLASFVQVLRLELNVPTSAQVRWRSWVLVGFSVGLSMSIKQTQGLWTVLGVVALLFIFNRCEGVAMRQKLALIAAGISVVWIPLALWLSVNGVTPFQLVDSVYLNGGPKGSAWEIFFGWARDIFNLGELRLVRPVASHWLAMLQGVFPYLAIALIAEKLAKSREEDKIFEVSVLVGLAASGVALWYIKPKSLGSLTSVLDYTWGLLEFNRVIAWLVLPFFLLWLHWRKFPRATASEGAAITACSIAVVWACGMSAGITEIGDFLSIPVALSFLVFVGRRRWFVLLLAGIVALSVATASWWKTEDQTRFAWWAYQTPREQDATVKFEIGLLDGLWTSPQVLDTYEEMRTQLISASACPGEIVAYPHIPLFLLDVGALPGGRLGQYWYDFSSSSEIAEEVKRLSRTNISAIVMMQLPEYVLEMHEQLFNNSKPLPHHKLQDLLSMRAEEFQLVVSEEISSEASLSLWVSECVVRTAAGASG